MRIELCCCTDVLISEIASPQFTQKSIALTYAMAYLSSDETNWHFVNEKIVERFGLRGLGKIKRMAWKKIQEKVMP